MKTLIILYLITFCLLNLKAQYAISNGYSLPSKDTTRVLVLFAEVDFSKGPCYSNLTDNLDGDWGKKLDGKTRIPVNADDYFNANASSILTKEAVITGYYRQASLGAYILLGDYYPEVLSVPCAKIKPGDNGVNLLLQMLDSIHADQPTVTTAHGLTLKDFDSWTMTEPGKPKIHAPDGRIDLIYIVWRNNRFLYGTSTGPNAGYGVTIFNGRPCKDVLGTNNMSSFNAAHPDNHAFGMALTEHLHGLFGGNHWHAAGGKGIHTFLGTPATYGLCSQMSATMLSACAWDRWMLNWKNPAKKYLVSALDSKMTEVNTEGYALKNSPRSAIYYLRDFLPTGDAVQIKLPGFDWKKTGDVKNQYIWLEYHSLENRFEDYAPETCSDNNNGRFKNGAPGIFAYYQIGKDMKSGAYDIHSSDVRHPNGLASYLMPLTAEGNFDFNYRRDLNPQPQNIACCWNNQSLPMDKKGSLPNPFTGFSDLYFNVDYNQDGKLFSGDNIQPGLSEVDMNDSVVYNFFVSGDYEDSFSLLNGHRMLSISGNPAPVPVYTHTTDLENGRSYFKKNDPSSSYENRTIHLNGLSMEVLEQDFILDGYKAAKIRIRWDDFLLRKSVRWCGNIVLYPNPFAPDSASLIVSQGKTILLDRGLSPVYTKAIGSGDTARWNDTTVFTVKAGAHLRLEKKSSIHLKSGSKLIFEPGSYIYAGKKSYILAEEESVVVLPATVNLLNGPVQIKYKRKK